MVQPTNTFSSYDAVGIREDLTNVIYDISPEETPFMSSCAKVGAANTLHEWQTDSLRASQDNAHVEGDDTTADSRSPTTRLGNYTQIFKNAVVVPGTDDATKKAGRGKDMAYHVLKTGKEQKLDIERALFLNQARVGGNDTTARRLAGVPTWLTTNTVFETGGAPSGADPTGDGTDTRTDNSVTVAFDQARFDSAMQSIWVAGGKPDTVYLSSFQMDVALGFVGMNNQRSTITATRNNNMVVRDFDLYVTPWGNVTFIPSRENRSRDVFIMQSDMWAIASLRGMKNEALAKTGDSNKRQVLCELTLESRNEAASGGVYDNSIV